MRVNRYPGRCDRCAGPVAPNAGRLVGQGTRRGFRVRHLACDEAGHAAVITVELADGHTFTRNARGTCEDAPCCGCCTF